MEVLKIKRVHGVELVEFVPSPSMRIYALSAFCDPKLIGKKPDVICRAIGLGANSYKSFLQYEPHFSEWLEETRAMLGGKNKRALLEYVGMEKAAGGDFAFWKAMAIKHGVIETDKLTIGVDIPSNLSALGEMDESKLLAYENTILATLRGEAEPGKIDDAEGDPGWEPEGDPTGAAEVPPESVVLADKLGADGECPLQGLDAF